MLKSLLERRIVDKVEYIFLKKYFSKVVEELKGIRLELKKLGGQSNDKDKEERDGDEG